MNEVTLIKTENVLGKDFRIYGTVENPLFLAKDVAEWIEHSNLTVMVNSVDEDEKVVLEPSKDCLVGNFQANTKYTFLTENGLYEVLMLSRKPIAKEFKKEVKKVLHSLRVNGGYIVNQENLTPEQIVANALIVAQKIIADKDKLLAEQKPKVEFYDAVTGSDKAIDMGQVAKVLNIDGFGRTRLFKFLRDKNILDRRNIPYQRYVEQGYFRVIESKFDMPDGSVGINLKTVVFQKGVDYIRKLVDSKSA